MSTWVVKYKVRIKDSPAFVVLAAVTLEWRDLCWTGAACSRDGRAGTCTEMLAVSVHLKVDVVLVLSQVVASGCGAEVCGWGESDAAGD
jgi:hypothetical protein